MGTLTGELPKPMLHVKDKPILQHIIEGMAKVGIRQIHIIVGYRAETIEDFFAEGRELGLELSYSHQLTQDGTGKAPELAKNFVAGDPFLLTYGDILVKAETYRQIIERFSQDNFSAVVAATAGEEVTKGGFLIFDERFCLDTLIEKPSIEELQTLRQTGKYSEGDPIWYNAGIYIFQPSLFDYTSQLKKSPRGEYELTDAIIAMSADGRAVAGQKIQGSWVDVRDPEVLRSLGSADIE